jgi:hypothetical protein
VLGSPYLRLRNRQSAHAYEESASGYHRDQPVLHSVLLYVIMRSGYSCCVRALNKADECQDDI